MTKKRKIQHVIVKALQASKESILGFVATNPKLVTALASVGVASAFTSLYGSKIFNEEAFALLVSDSGMTYDTNSVDQSFIIEYPHRDLTD
jgi:hypothetical protein